MSLKPKPVREMPPELAELCNLIPSGLIRGQGIRVGRYIGTAKIHLQALFTGVAVNLQRAARWLAGERPQAKRQGLRLSQKA
jgi:hypothetical protein